MIQASTKISFGQVFMMFSLMNGLASHIIVNPMVLGAAGRDSWITSLVTGGLFLIWLVMLVWLMKRTGQQEWKKWLSSRVTPLGSFLLVLPICIQMYMIGGLTVVQTTTWHITNYLPNSPKILLVSFLIVFCTAISLWGIQVIAIVSGILLPIVVGLGIFVSTANTSRKDYSLLKPVLEHGWGPVLDGMVYAGAGFVEIIALILLQHHMKTKVRVWQLMIYGLFSIVISIGPLIGALTEFGPIEAAHQMTSPYEQWRLVTIGKFIENLDFFSIFQWLSGACIRISLSVFIVVELLPLKSKRSRSWAIVAIMVSYLFSSMRPANEFALYKWMQQYYMPISLIVLVSVSFLWMIVALIFGSARREGKV